MLKRVFSACLTPPAVIPARDGFRALDAAEARVCPVLPRAPPLASMQAMRNHPYRQWWRRF